MMPSRNREQTDRANNTAIAQLRLGRDDGVRDIMIDCLLIPSHQLFCSTLRQAHWGRTEYASNLTSNSVPSLNVHFTISVSVEAP
jgi:hypothetical protein